MLRTQPSQFGWKRSCTNDEGRPLDVGVQAQASNRHKRRALRAPVVSVAGKGEAGLRQVRVEKTNASEPLMMCRNLNEGVETGIQICIPRRRWSGNPVDGSTGVRHEGGVISTLALVRNVGTCRPDAKGEIQADDIGKNERTDAGHRGGVIRSRSEGSVMDLDRRGDIIRLYSVGNSQEEDSHG